MKQNLHFAILVVLALSLWLINLNAQTAIEHKKTIYLMRAKQFYGSGASMNLMVNGQLFHKIKNGHRLIIKSSTSDTLNIQVVYPLIKKYKSKVLQILPGDENELYIDLFYWGEAYNPFKHAGAIRGPIGSTPEFNIEVAKMEKTEGEKKFDQTDKFKDEESIVEKRFPITETPQ